MANPPFIVTQAGGTEDAPKGSVPVDFYGIDAGGEAPVTSVNGATGAVVLEATDVGAAATTHTHTAAQVASGTLADARIPALAIEGRLDALETAGA